MDTKVLAPRILFGSTKDTRSKWSRVARAAMNAQDPAEVFGGLDLIEITPDMSEFVIYELSPGWKTSQAIWHFNWIHTRWPFASSNGHQSWKSQLRIVLAGLAFKWYSFGMLFNGLSDFYFLKPQSIKATPDSSAFLEEDIREQVSMPFLNGLLKYISLLRYYSGRFAYSYPCCELTKVTGASWMRGILHVAHGYGICDTDVIRRCSELSYNEVISHLRSKTALNETLYGYALPESG